MTTPTPHTATMRATMDELRSVLIKARGAYRLAQKAFPVDSEPFRTINREANLLDSIIGGLSDRIEDLASASAASHELRCIYPTACEYPRCMCPEKTALPAATQQHAAQERAAKRKRPKRRAMKRLPAALRALQSKE